MGSSAATSSSSGSAVWDNGASRSRPLPKRRPFRSGSRSGKGQRVKKLERGNVALADYFDQWLLTKRKLAPSTRLRYEGIGRDYIRGSRIGSLRLRDLSRDDIERWISDLEGGNTGAATIIRPIRTLRASLNDAVLAGKLMTNPAARIATPTSRTESPASSTSWKSRPSPMNTSAVPGARPCAGVHRHPDWEGDCAADSTDLDLMHGSLTIRANSPEVAGLKLHGKTKTKSVRSIKLSPELIEELQRHIKLFGPQAISGGVDPDAYLFTGEKGGQVRQNNWRVRAFQPACHTSWRHQELGGRHCRRHSKVLSGAPANSFCAGQRPDLHPSRPYKAKVGGSRPSAPTERMLRRHLLKRFVPLAKDAGVSIDHHEAPDMLHEYPLLPIPAAKDARRAIAKALTH